MGQWCKIQREESHETMGVDHCKREMLQSGKSTCPCGHQHANCLDQQASCVTYQHLISPYARMGPVWSVCLFGAADKKGAALRLEGFPWRRAASPCPPRFVAERRPGFLLVRARIRAYWYSTSQNFFQIGLAASYVTRQLLLSRFFSPRQILLYRLFCWAMSHHQQSHSTAHLLRSSAH